MTVLQCNKFKSAAEVFCDLSSLKINGPVGQLPEYYNEISGRENKMHHLWQSDLALPSLALSICRFLLPLK